MAAKLAWQVALAGSLVGLVEAMAFANQIGVEKTVMLQLLTSSDSPSASIARAFGKAIIEEDFVSGLEVKSYLDDLNIALEAADEISLPLPGLETIQQLFDLLQLIGDDRRGIQSLALAYYDERNAERFGLDWSLAQKAMDVYEKASDEYDVYDDPDDDEEDSDFHRYHDHDHPQEGHGFDPYKSGTGGEGFKPSAGSFFSEN
jgi:hypothetical protein